MRSRRWTAAWCGLLALSLLTAGCLQPAEERAEDDLRVGRASVGGASFTVVNGLATFHGLEGGAIRLWAQAPSLTLEVDATAEGAGLWEVTVDNCMPGSALSGPDGVTIEALEADLPTVCRFDVELPPGPATLQLTAPLADVRSPYSFAVLSDIQERIDDVPEIFEKINEQEGIEFVVSTGDLTSQGSLDQLERFQDHARGLRVPFYSTIGNHETFAEEIYWHDVFGRANFHFTHRGVHFTFVDSADSTVDPMVYDWLEGWLSAGASSVHVFVTHIAPVDPVGARNGSFRSRKEAAKILAMLAEAEVDVSLYGHIHSLYAFSNAGIPAYISGGGGALPERLDGIERHFLIADVTPGAGIDRVSVVRVD